MGRKKSLPLLERVEITGIGAEGNAFARVDDMVVFVPGLIPGDIADLQVVRKRRRFMEARVVKFHEYSTLRTDPVCNHFGVCGGCRWQHLPYEEQLKFKAQQVTDNLTRIGKVDLPVIKPILGSENIYNYRNKLEYTFSNRRWLTQEEISSDVTDMVKEGVGFHIPGLFDKVVDVEKCHLQAEPTNEIRNFVRQFTLSNKMSFFDIREQHGLLRNLIVRNTTTGGLMVIVVFFEYDADSIGLLMNAIAEAFPSITSLFYIVNSKRNDSLTDQEPVLWSGDEFITEKMDDLSFRIGPKSFFQTNSQQALNLYRIVKEYASLKGTETVYDLYTGTGTIALYIANEASRVIGLEYVPEAVEDAVINMGLNNIKNASFYSGDIKDLLTPGFFERHGSPDVIITDPPRAGMHENVVKAILDAAPERVVYVSCNPATQARDISLLSEKYRVEAVQPVDMFPHTNHIENVALLIRI